MQERKGKFARTRFLIDKSRGILGTNGGIGSRMAHRKFICIIRMKKNMWITDAGREKLQFSQEMNRAVKEEAVD